MLALRHVVFVAMFLSGVAAGCTAPQSIPPQEPAARTTIPLALTLSVEPEGDAWSVDATVATTGRLPGPVVFRLQLPEGVKLVEGNMETTRSAPEPGGVCNVHYKVTGSPTGLRISVDSASASAGIHAAASWPPAAPRTLDAPEMVPIAPVKMFGIEVDRAVIVGPQEDKR
jgi:hypothetical protein